MQTAGILIGTLTEFTSGVKIGKHQFHGRDLEFWVGVYRDSTAIITITHNRRDSKVTSTEH